LAFWSFGILRFAVAVAGCLLLARAALAGKEEKAKGDRKEGQVY